MFLDPYLIKIRILVYDVPFLFKLSSSCLLQNYNSWCEFSFIILTQNHSSLCEFLFIILTQNHNSWCGFLLCVYIHMRFAQGSHNTQAAH